MKRIHALGIPCIAVVLAVATLPVRSAPAPAAPSPAKPASTRPAGAPAKAGEPLASFDEIRKTFEAGEHAKTLELIGKVLARGKRDTKAYDRYELLTLKGEAHLQLKQLASASNAFGAAAKETDDPVKAATARATQQVFREAKAFVVQRRTLRKGEKAQPARADVLDRDQRVDAFKILYEDLRVAAEPKVKSALRARELTEIDAAAKLVTPMHDLELAITGDDDEQVATQRQLGERAGELIRKELNEMRKDVTEMHALANEIVQERVTRSSGAGLSAGGLGVNGVAAGDRYEIIEIRRGLSDRDRTDLDRIIKTCQRIVPAAGNLEAMLGNANDAKDLGADARTVGRAADRLLKDFPKPRYRDARGVSTQGQ